MVHWLEVTIEATPQRLDAITARLTMNGVQGFVIEDEEDFKNFLAQNQQYWDYVAPELLDYMKGASRVKFYVTDDAHGQGQLKDWMVGVDEPYTTTRLKENDWATSWQKYYRPMAVGEKLYIVPEWERENLVPQGRTPLYLNPGLTFGTGSHPSTQLCLEGLECHLKKGHRVLDLGCGSGILSIATLVLGASSALALDIDPKAVDVAYENAALNGIGKDVYQVFDGDILGNQALRKKLEPYGYDVILVNIVADVIIPLSAYALEWMAPEGVFLCSGIIDTREEDVIQALQLHGLLVLERREKNGWVSLVARKKEDGDSST